MTQPIRQAVNAAERVGCAHDRRAKTISVGHTHKTWSSHSGRIAARFLLARKILDTAFFTSFMPPLGCHKHHHHHHHHQAIMASAWTYDFCHLRQNGGCIFVLCSVKRLSLSRFVRANMRLTCEVAAISCSPSPFGHASKSEKPGSGKM